MYKPVIVVGKRNPTPCDLADAEIRVVIAKTDDPAYLSVRVGKHRAHGNPSGRIYPRDPLDRPISEGSVDTSYSIDFIGASGCIQSHHVKSDRSSPIEARGQTASTHTFEESPFIKDCDDNCLRVTIDMSHLDGLELHLPLSENQRTYEEIVPGPLRDIQDKLAEGFGNTLKECAGIEPQPVHLSTDWSDLD